MSLSFKDSLNSVSAYADTPAVLAEMDKWDFETEHYRQFENFDDSNTSVISAAKEITLKGD